MNRLCDSLNKPVNVDKNYIARDRVYSLGKKLHNLHQPFAKFCKFHVFFAIVSVSVFSIFRLVSLTKTKIDDIGQPQMKQAINSFINNKGNNYTSTVAIITINTCLSLLETLEPWANQETLLRKHLSYQCFPVCPLHKTLLRKQNLLPRSKNVSQEILKHSCC